MMPFLIKLSAFFSLSLWTTTGVDYYVKPTEPCVGNGSSCPTSEEACHIMDHYASNSNLYSSPDHNQYHTPFSMWSAQLLC